MPGAGVEVEVEGLAGAGEDAAQLLGTSAVGMPGVRGAEQAEERAVQRRGASSSRLIGLLSVCWA
ncbi:MAG: hypothetical protein U0802_05815 [Candidatus Binatia bacterium]